MTSRKATRPSNEDGDQSLKPCRKKVDRLLSQHRYAGTRVGEERKTLREAKLQVSHTEQAQVIVQEVARTIQQNVHKQISTVVTEFLRAVFGEEQAYEFRIMFDKKRGKTEARLVFVRDGEEIDPTTAAGLGAVDVASLALRLAALLLVRPAKRRLLVCDEPFRHLSSEHTEKVGQAIFQLAERIGMQMIVVTHNRDLQVGKVVEISHKSVGQS